MQASIDYPQRKSTHALSDEFTLIEWSCPTCGAGEETFLGYRAAASGKASLTSRLVRCDGCSLIYANPFPVSRNIPSLYAAPATYFAGHNAKEKILANREILKKMKARTTGDPLVIDVGSGCGELLVAAQQENIQAVGIEISQGMVAAASQVNSVMVFQKTIEESARDWPEAFTGVVLNAVLEHAYNPDEMIASARKLLKPGGVLYIDVPNEPNILTFAAGGLNRILGGNKSFCLSPTWEPYHVYGFNPRSIKILLQKHGFEIEELTVFSRCGVGAQTGLVRRTQGWVANWLNHIGNLTGTSGNLSLWARLKK